MKRIIGAVLAVIAIALVIVLFVTSNHGSPTTSATSKALVKVTGVIGSEKSEFFADARVKKIFRDNGLDVQVETAGSREIATTVDLSKYNFAFPASAPAAVKIQQKVKNSTAYSPFFSPMVIGTYKPIMELLAKNGVASQNAAGVWHIDMSKYLALVKDGKRWNQLTGAASLYNSPRSVLISSTDIRKSNSAAMYLAIASYVLNGNNVVSTKAQEDKIISEATNLFINQGFSESSSDEPFQNYLSQGIGAVPMVMIYEAQFVGEANAKDSRITKDMVMAYPDPTVFSKHTLLAFNTGGNKVGTLLTQNKELVALESEYGFRTPDTSAFTANAKKNNVAIESSLTDIAEVPSYDVLEDMITNIEQKYNIAAANLAGGLN